MASRILIVAFEKRWLAPVHMPALFREHGAEVALLAHVDSWPARLLQIDRFYPAPNQPGGREDLYRIKGAIDDWKPDLVLPGDDLSYAALQVGVLRQTDWPVSDSMRLAIVRASGDPAGCPILMSKANTLARARELDIREPENVVVTTEEAAFKYGAAHDWKVVLKLDGESGGFGVVQCRSRDEIQVAYRRLAEILVRRGMLGKINVSVQRLIEGERVACVFSAWQGAVLTGMAFKKLNVFPEPNGPATSVAPISLAEIGETTRKMVASCAFSGMGSIDFVVENDQATMLEFNPRMTQISHLPRYWGIDPCAALLSALHDQPYKSEKVGDPPSRITLFPQEWWRDHQSAELKSGVVDGPFDEPLVMRAIAPDWR